LIKSPAVVLTGNEQLAYHLPLPVNTRFAGACPGEGDAFSTGASGNLQGNRIGDGCGVQRGGSSPFQGIDAAGEQVFSRRVGPVTCRSSSLVKLRLALILQYKKYWPESVKPCRLFP
jgi:hypothetical protein